MVYRRIWRTWFELPADRETTETEQESESSSSTSRGRQIERSLGVAHSPSVTQRTVIIDKTIARANILLHPFKDAGTKSAASISRDRRAALIGYPQHVHPAKIKRATIAWKSLELNVARVVVEHELAQKKQAGQILLFWSNNGSATVQRNDG